MVKTVYFALLYPHIQYCKTSWGCAAKPVLNPLIKLQKGMVRIMTFSHNNDILLRTHGPYHRHKNTKSG